MNNARNDSDRANFDDKLDRDVLAMASGEGRAALFAAPSFQKTLVDKGLLKKAFTGSGWGSFKDKDYDAFVAKLPKPATPEPVAPAAPAA